MAPSIDGVGSSTTAFVGATPTGPAGRTPELLTSVTDFERHYGAAADLVFTDGTRAPNFLWHAARAFFANGGRRLYVVRVGRNGDPTADVAEFFAALEQLEEISDIAIVAAPGATFRYEQERPGSASRIQALLDHARTKSRFAVIDCGDRQSAADVRAMRAAFDSSYGALYYPWVRVVDPASGRDVDVPPSGFVSGVYARVDLSRGVHHAPANETLEMAAGLEREIPSAEQRSLNAEGINCLRRLPEKGLRVWGARTLSSDPEWKYVNVRRLLIFLEASIERGIQWAVFEPNDERLWTQVRGAIGNFLSVQWHAGALMGSRPEEAYFVRCDRTTMTQDDLDSGRLVCLVGVAPTRPAEFVIFRIGVGSCPT
jgi:phage tail sheath protein FI